MSRSSSQKWFFAFNGVPLVALVIGLKTLAWVWNWQILDLNPLFTGLIAAAIFLLGFLISGILSDYKESEKLPGELALSIETLFHEVLPIYKSKNSDEVSLSPLDLTEVRLKQIIESLERPHAAPVEHEQSTMTRVII